MSGHPSRDELIEMYSYIKPKISIPVHGTREHIEAHADLASNCQVPNVIKPKNGEIIKLNANTPNAISKIDFTTHVFDAGEIIPINNERFTTRRHSLWNGFVTISIVINKDGYLVITPQISQTGVSDSSIVENVLIDLSLKIEDFIENISSFKEMLDEELINQISKLVRREFKLTFSKRPIVKVHVNRV